MGAVKNMAIELEIRQEKAASLGDAATAYRLGMLEACRLINEVGGQYIGDFEADPYLAVNNCWMEVFNAANYLGEVTRR